MSMAAYAGPRESDLAPDQDVAWTFLSWWFSDCTHGRIEIGWLDSTGLGLVHFRRFDLDDMVGVAKAACDASAVPGQSVYVRASTVTTPDDGAVKIFTTDSEFAQAPGVWGDLDTPEQMDRARKVNTLVRPNASVITGRLPHLRAQTFFKADTPITDADMVRGLNRRIVALYGGDPAVVNPTRLMRLPGTIAWPWKPGRVPEMTSFAQSRDGRPECYSAAALAAQLPQVAPLPEGATGEPLPATLNSAREMMRRIAVNKDWHLNMVRLVAHWIGRGWSNAEILAVAETFTLPGYTHQQTRAEVGKAIEGGRRKWAKPDIETPVEGTETDGFSAYVYDPWDTLVPPEFPLECLPGALQDFVGARSRSIGCDPAALAWSCISACSAAVDGQSRLIMRRNDGWRVPPAIWVALVGPSSSKKTPCINAAWAPLERIQGKALRAWSVEKDQWDALPKKDRDQTAEPAQPIRYITHGATIESLQAILSRQDRGIAVMHDELSGLIEGMDRYSGGKGGDRPFYLQAYNGGNYVIDRIGRGTSCAANLLLTICGGIQPAKLAQFKDLSDDGLWQRFVPVIMKPSEMGLDEAPGAEDRIYSAMVEQMAAHSGGITVQFSEAGHDIRQLVEEECFALERGELLGAKFASFCGKMPGLFGRLCLVLSQMEGLPFSVSAKTAKAARMLVNNVVLHAGRIAMNMGGDADVETVQAIAGFILAKKKDRVITGELSRDVRACRKQSVAQIQKFVSPLVAGGWLLAEKEHAGNTAWTVNPCLHDRFHDRAQQEAARRVAIREQIFGMEE